MSCKMVINNIDISVIIPMYNVENLILETLESVVKNKCNFEVLIINDGSSDNSFTVASDFCKDNPKFKIITQENQGVSVARNLGLDLAKGDFICFLDSDDLLTENALDKMLEAAKENDADLVYGAVKKFNRKKQWYLSGHIRKNIFRPGMKSLKENPELVHFIGVGAKLISKNLLRNKRFPQNIKFSEDTVIIYQSYLNAKKIFAINDTVYLYRERDLTTGNASATQLANVKSYSYLKDCFKSLLILNNETMREESMGIDDKKSLVKKLYDRFYAYEIWPFFTQILINDKSNINNALYDFLDFLKQHGNSEINSIATFRFYFIKVFIDQLHNLSIQNIVAYRSLLSFLFNSLNSQISKLCMKENVYGDKWHDSYKIACGRLDKAIIHFNYIRAKKYIFNEIKRNPKVIREKYFPLVSKLPLEKNKVVFATTRPKPMSSNFNAVYNEIRHQDYKIYKFFGESKKVKSILKRYYHFATAEYVFLEDYYKPVYGLKFRDGTKVVQLWHACGAFKRFGISALNKRDSHDLSFEIAAHASYTNVITSSKAMNDLYAEAFGTHKSNVYNVGVPRTDIFFDGKKLTTIHKKLSNAYPNLRDTVNILYAPTFRGNSSERSVFNFNIDWESLIQELPENYRILIKLHPQVKIVQPSIPDELSSRVMLLSSSIDINELMVFCDALITDYSSLIFEYSLLDKPIIYYPYDFKDYVDERGFYYPYEDYVYGEVAYNTSELVYAINTCFSNYSEYQVKRGIFKERFMSNCDGKSTKKLLNMVFK